MACATLYKRTNTECQRTTFNLNSTRERPIIRRQTCHPATPQTPDKATQPSLCFHDNEFKPWLKKFPDPGERIFEDDVTLWPKRKMFDVWPESRVKDFRVKPRSNLAHWTKWVGTRTILHLKTNVYWNSRKLLLILFRITFNYIIYPEPSRKPPLKPY